MNTETNRDDKAAKNQDLSPLIASSIHELKNQFSTVLIHIQSLLQNLNIEEDNRINIINGELKLISHRFGEMLGSFKSQNFDITPNIDQQDMEAFFEDISIKHTLTESTHNIKIRTSCDDEIFGYFDDKLIQNIVDTAIYNAVQLKDEVNEILITAAWDETKKNGENIIIRIEDNGPGFPDEVLANTARTTNIDFSEQSMKSGLGLYLASKIASAHKRSGESGHIELNNGQNLKGACLSIHLP